MLKERTEPLDVSPIKGGWAAYGDGWAVHGHTKEEAVRLYQEAVRKHEEMAARVVDAPEEGASH